MRAKLACLALLALSGCATTPGEDHLAELKRVLVVQAAMPSAVVSIIVARVYGGQPLVAVQIILGTTALALFTIPLWIRFGLAFAGLAP